MDRKYYAQITFKTELPANSNFKAWDDLEELCNHLKEYCGIFGVEILNSIVISDPSDEEFLESLCVN